MCYAARVQILLGSVDIRISTEYISSSQAHHITSHNTTLDLKFTFAAAVSTVEIKLNPVPVQRKLENAKHLLFAYWNQPILCKLWTNTNWRRFNVKYINVIMLNVYFAFIYFYLNFQHRNETLVRLLKSPAVMLRLVLRTGRISAANWDLDHCGSPPPQMWHTGTLTASAMAHHSPHGISP